MTDCPLCKSPLTILILTKEEMRWRCWEKDKYIFKCLECQLEFLYPQWTDSELDELYKGYHQQSDFKGQKQAPRISKYLIKFIKKGFHFLEIGCGKGENLHYIVNKLGYNNVYGYGIDKDPSVVNCRRMSLISITNPLMVVKDYKTLDIDFKLDFIYAIQVLEHLKDPFEFINKILSLLRPKGRFVLEFPNLNDPLLRLYKIEEFKKFYYIPHHHFFYNETSAKKLFEKAGISVKIKRIQRYGILNHLRWIILRRPGNFHPYLPILDDIYKFVLTNIFKISDTLIVIGEKK